MQRRHGYRERRNRYCSGGAHNRNCYNHNSYYIHRDDYDLDVCDLHDDEYHDGDLHGDGNCNQHDFDDQNCNQHDCDDHNCNQHDRDDH